MLGNAGVGRISSDGANWKSEPQSSALIILAQDRLIKIIVISQTDHLFSAIGKSLSCWKRLGGEGGGEDSDSGTCQVLKDCS